MKKKSNLLLKGRAKRKDDFVICCDMDDTIEHLCSAWCSWLNNKHNLCVNWEDIDQWDMTKIYPTLTKSEIYEPLSDADFWLTDEPIQGAQETLKRLIDEGYTVYIVTTTHYKCVGVKFKNCLFRLFPFIDRHNVIVTCNKQMVKCDLLIDDGPHNIIGDYIGLLMSAPHNRHFDDTKYETVIRVDDWNTIYNIIHSMTI